MSDREQAWAEAMRAANGGDGAAYARLLTEIAPVLRRVVAHRLARLGLGAAEAEDVVQETLLALHLKRGTWEGDRPFLPWLHGIARYKLLDAARRLGRTARHRVDLPYADWCDSFAAPEADTDSVGLDRGRLIATLPLRERSVVEALAVEGLDISAAATRLSISEGAVRVAFHRGLSRLRRLADLPGPPARAPATGIKP